jgi:hypothetical protein
LEVDDRFAERGGDGGTPAITGVATRAEPGHAVLLDFRQTYAGPWLIDVEDFLVPAVFPTTATSTRRALGVA